MRISSWLHFHGLISPAYHNCTSHASRRIIAGTQTLYRLIVRVLAPARFPWLIGYDHRVNENTMTSSHSPTARKRCLRCQALGLGRASISGWRSSSGYPREGCGDGAGCAVIWFVCHRRVVFLLHGDHLSCSPRKTTALGACIAFNWLRSLGWV